MTDTLDFTIDFHTPFRVGASYGTEGIDLTFDADEPLNAAHLKGLMRAAARHTLALPGGVVDATFGTPAAPSAWAWTAAAPVGQWSTPRLRHRIKVDPDTHTVLTDHLVAAQQQSAVRAVFTVSRHRHLAADAGATQQLVLRAAAAAVHGIGGWRRRGLGWVGITPQDPITAADVAALRRLDTGRS